MTVTFGEIMLRLSPPGYERFMQTHSYNATFGGGEANVAVSLRHLGVSSRFVTKLPQNDIGFACRAELRKHGVDTEFIAFGGDRIGIYFCEKGASQRASKVIYDRAGSSIAMAQPMDFDFEEIFEGAGWFHFTGITPALSDGLAEIALNACKIAKEKGITVSCDLNYRKKLWSKQKAGEVMAKFMPYVDLVIANEEDVEIFGIHADGSDAATGQINLAGYENAARLILEKYNVPKIAITLRESVSASTNNWSALLFDGEFYKSKKYKLDIVDRVGGGDSFVAGLIYGYVNSYSPADALEFAVASSCLKHSIEGDFNYTSADEVNALLKSGGSGRVVR